MKKTNGIGAQARAKKAISVPAQLTPGREDRWSSVNKATAHLRVVFFLPRFAYMFETNRGNATPNKDRRIEFAAKTEAAYSRYESIK